MTLPANRLLFQSRGARIALTLFACLLTLGAAEFALRLFPGVAPRTALDIYRKDSGGDLLLRPGIERRHRTRHWDVSIRTDERGFRTSALSFSASREGVASARASSGDMELAASILVLGDSFAFGSGVESEETFPSLVQQQLKQTMAARITNAAVPGTGPSDQLRLLKKLFPAEMPAVVPACVLCGQRLHRCWRGWRAAVSRRRRLSIPQEPENRQGVPAGRTAPSGSGPPVAPIASARATALFVARPYGSFAGGEALGRMAPRVRAGSPCGAACTNSSRDRANARGARRNGRLLPKTIVALAVAHPAAKLSGL